MSEPKACVCQLSPEQKEFAAVYLNESEEIREKEIANIRRWILENEDIYCRTDDFFLLRFLRACKFNEKKTKCKLRNYLQQRSIMPTWYSNRDPFLPELQELFNLGVFLPLHKPDNGGRITVIIRAAVHDPTKHKQENVIKAGMMILDIATRENILASLYGVSAILDLQGVTLGHALQMTPTVIKNLVHSWQGCYPLRIHSLDFVNAPVYVNVILKIFKSFMNQKLKSRVYVHGRGKNTFLDKIPAEILPVEYGGSSGCVQDLIEYWKTVVEENKGWLIDDEKYKILSVN